MTPFCVQNLILKFKEDFKIAESIEHLRKLSLEKNSFCCDFEKELGLVVCAFSADIFDYAYNLFFLRKTFAEKRFKELLEEFLELDFSSQFSLVSIFNQRYLEFSSHLPLYFAENMGISNPDDELNSTRKICELKKIGGHYSWKLKTDTIERLIKYANSFG